MVDNFFEAYFSRSNIKKVLTFCLYSSQNTLNGEKDIYYKMLVLLLMIYIEMKTLRIIMKDIQGAPEINANLYCNFEYLYWEGCVICNIYLR